MTTGQSPRTLKTAEQVQADREADAKRRNRVLVPQAGAKDSPRHRRAPKKVWDPATQSYVVPKTKRVAA